MRRQNWFVMLPSVAIVGALLACSATSLTEGTGAEPSITPSVTATSVLATTTEAAPTQVPPTEAPPSETPPLAAATAGPGPAASAAPEGPMYGALIYQTDFTVGWPEVVSGEQGRSAPTDGGYRFDIGPRWGHYVYTATVTEGALYAQVQANALACPAGDSGYGLMFHLLSADQFRYAVITCDGGYILRELGQGAARTLASGTLPAGIDPAAGLHTIGVHTLDNLATLYVDGVQVAQVELADMPAGEVGPYVKTEAESVSILFTRLEVSQAQ